MGYVIRSLLRGAKKNTIVMFILTVAFSAVLSFTFANPLSLLSLHMRWKDAGLDQTALFVTDYRLMPWGFPESPALWPPAYRGLLDELNALPNAEIISPLATNVQINKHQYAEDAPGASIYTMPNGFFEKIDIPLSEGVWGEGISPQGHIPVVMSTNAKAYFKLGDIVNLTGDIYDRISVDTFEITAEITGFLNDNDELISLGASNDAQLSLLISNFANTDWMAMITPFSETMAVLSSPQNYNAHLITTKSGGNILASIDEWKRIVESKNIGEIYSFADMQANDFSMATLRQLDFWIMSILILILFVLGMQGYYSSQMQRWDKQMLIYGMLGLRKSKRLLAYLIAGYAPVYLAATMGYILAQPLVARVSDVSGAYPFLLLLLVLIVVTLSALPGALIDMRRWSSKSAVSLWRGV